MDGKAQPVDVISVCTTSGDIRPLRLRVEDGTGNLLRVDIQEVLEVREISYVGIEAKVFLCRGAVEGRLWLFELKYSIRSHCWSVLSRLH